MDLAVYQTKLGKMCIGYEGDCLRLLKKAEETEENFGKKTAFTDKVYSQLVEYFEGKRKVFDFNYEMHGTDFQKKVWKALIEIPYGETRSYKDIAISIGNDKASRAVGLANNKNPLIVLVPCHRVIGKNGKLVGYAGGLDMKSYLLEMESANK